MMADKKQNDNKNEKKRKESILDLSKYLEKQIRVKFAGGRECSGVLKGFDPLLNLVLDNTTEYLRDPGKKITKILPKHPVNYNRLLF
ncbi:hypothetical protein ACKWTF_001452 [Chironomus riparius]